MPRERVAGEKEGGGDDEDGAGERQGAGALAQDHDGHGDGEEGPRGPRQRVDDGKVATASIGAVEKQEVGGVDDAAQEHQGEVHGPEVVALDPGRARDHRRVGDEGDEAGRGDQAGPAAALLEQEFPARVDEGGGEDEGEGEPGHRAGRSVAAAVMA